MHTLGRLLGIDDLESIDSLSVALGAPWAQDAPFWIFAASIGLIAASLLFYLQRQAGNRMIRIGLAVIRGAILSLLLLTLSEPVLQLEIVNRLRPLIFIVVDGTESMAIDDDYPSVERAAIDRAVGRDPASGSENPTRMQYMQLLFSRGAGNWLSQLASDKQADVEMFGFNGTT